MIIEKNADHGSFSRQLKKVFTERSILCRVIDETERTAKHARIVTYVYGNREKIHYSKESSPEFMTQIRRYDEAIKPCDAPDAVAGLMRRLTRQVRRFY